ncbi:hypothetical protein BKA81DRAFT_22877 [Phyllosticta paracitricarpa]
MASRTLRFLSSSQVMILHEMRVARATPIQSEMLEFATLSPVNTNSYEGHANVFHLAAILARPKDHEEPCVPGRQ